MARLRISFRGAQTTVSLLRGETTVGCDKHCTIHLPDPRLAPIHFRIRARERGFQLKDDGSGIGTLVNGRPVYATTLNHGDVIDAGGLRCVFLAEADRPAPATAPAAPPRRRIPALLWGALGAGVLAVGIAILLLRGEFLDREAAGLWREAVGELEASKREATGAEAHLKAAERLLERIESEYPSARVAGSATGALDDVRRALHGLERLRREGHAANGDLDEKELQAALARIAEIRVGAHVAVVRKARQVEEALEQARIARSERKFATVRERVAALVAKRNYGEALRTWKEFAPQDYHYLKRARKQRELLQARIGTEYRALLRLAARKGDLAARIGLLEASRPIFSGTAAADDLEVRISVLRVRRSEALSREREQAARKKPPAKPPSGSGPAPVPIEAGPYVDPPKVAALARARRYAEAAALLPRITRHPAAKVRGEELSLLADLWSDLVAVVAAEPGRFTSLYVAKGRGRADALGADAAGLAVRDAKGRQVRVSWSALPARSFPKLFRLAGFDHPPRLATALFFDEEGEENEARRRYVAVFKSAQDPALLTRILARRRGVPEPEGGFLLFRNDLKTPAEKEHLLLLDRIKKLGMQARSSMEKRRREAFAELETIGSPAVETLRAVLRARQEEVAARLAASQAFSPARFAARFGAELRKRRQEALRFILDPAKYPYPNKTEASQKEAERLVDRVKEIYEHPYQRLLEVSEKARPLDAELQELDIRLARVDPLSEPRRDAVLARIRKRLDAAAIPIDAQDRKRMEYNRAVETYNRELKRTSIDSEERADVEAVNRYRHMMGLFKLKIDERLVRCARKHSIEMQQEGYFAHESPTPKLKTPGLRARREGYPGGVSENIALGASTGVQAFWQWFRSSGHHRNMVVPGHTEMGCGSAAHHWWTQNFGRATGRSLKPPKIPPDPDPKGESGNGKPAPTQ